MSCRSCSSKGRGNTPAPGYVSSAGKPVDNVNIKKDFAYIPSNTRKI